MRVLAISPGLFETDVGGVATVMRHLAGGLVAAGHDIEVLTIPNAEHPASGEWQSIPYRQFRLRYRSIPSDFARALQLASHMRPDVINVHYPVGGVGLLAAALRVRARVPLVCSLHFNELTHPNPIDRAVARLVATVSCSITANSRYTAAMAGRIDGKRIVPIHNGVVLHARPDAVPPKTQYVAAAGSLVPHKNFHTLIRAFGAVARDFPTLALRIAGVGPALAELRDLANSVGAAGRVIFVGQVPPDALGDLLAGATITVVPSLAEPFGLVALEAMAAGCPVVVSGTGGLPEIVRDGEDGIHANPSDPASFAAAMRRLLSQPELRARLADSGLRRAALFSWVATCSQYAQVLSQAVGRRT